MYNSRVFKVEPVNQLEKLGTEKAEIYKHSNKWVIGDKNEQCLQEEPVEYGVSMPTHLLNQQLASIDTSAIPLN